jgi:hypothetical protein
MYWIYLLPSTQQTIGYNGFTAQQTIGYNGFTTQHNKQLVIMVLQL